MAKLKNTWFFPDLVGVDLGNGKQTTPAHSLIFGFWRCRESIKGWNSFENVDETAKALGMSTKTYKNLRSELVQAGWLIVERGPRNAVVKVTTADDDTLLTVLPHGIKNHSVSRTRDGASRTRETGTEVPPLNRINNRINKYSSSCPDGQSDEPSGFALAAPAGGSSFSSLVGPCEPSGEQGLGRRPDGQGVEQDGAGGPDPDPFAEPTNEPVFSLDPRKRGGNEEQRRIAAVANEVAKICQGHGFKITSGSVYLRKVVGARLKDGYTQEQIYEATQNYFEAPAKFRNKFDNVISVLAGGMFDKALNKTFGGEEDDVDIRLFV